MKYTAGGTAIATFTIASNECWKNSAGEPHEHTEWDDKQSGSKKYMTFVYADKVEFLGESQRDGEKGELTLDQSYSLEDPTMITDSDVAF